MLADLKIMRTFAPAIERESIGRKIIGIIGALVQLVRIHASRVRVPYAPQKSFFDLLKLLVR